MAKLQNLTVSSSFATPTTTIKTLDQLSILRLGVEGFRAASQLIGRVWVQKKGFRF